jgi:trehalose 6-phosphate synthase/phosphatase
MERLRGRLRLAGRMVCVGVDRLDYTKGLLERLRAIDALLHRDASWRGRVVFVQKASPSRTRIKAYRDLQQQVEDEIARINAAYGTPDWTPIVYIPRPMPPAGMAALYRMADACLVTSLQDGMNLVAKEFIASQVDARGVLILSELAGAAEEAPMSVMVNPYDQDGMVEALRAALRMPGPERARRMIHMRAHLARHDVRVWMAQHFRAAARLLESREATRPLPVRLDGLLAPLEGRERLAVLLDFDGTLAPMAPRPQEARLLPQARAALVRLARHPQHLVGVVSGRALDDIRGRVNLAGLYYVGNHGLEMAGPDVALTHEATAASRDLIACCAQRLRTRLREIGGVLVEDKGLSVSVHFRLATRDQIGRVERLVLDEIGRLPPGRFVVRRARMAFDIRPDVEWDKGRAVDWLLTHTVGPQWRSRCAVVYAGDDATDEDAFATIAGHGITIRVGPPQATAAAYRVADEVELARFLDALAAWADARSGAGFARAAAFS